MKVSAEAYLEELWEDAEQTAADLLQADPVVAARVSASCLLLLSAQMAELLKLLAERYGKEVHIPPMPTMKGDLFLSVPDPVAQVDEAVADEWHEGLIAGNGSYTPPAEIGGEG